MSVPDTNLGLGTKLVSWRVGLVTKLVSWRACGSSSTLLHTVMPSSVLQI